MSGTGPFAVCVLLTYIRAVRRYAEEIGNLDWAAPQDWMTEQAVRERTGLTVRAHQHRTVANYLRLRDLDPTLPIIPVLQGQSITDYHRCAASTNNTASISPPCHS